MLIKKTPINILIIKYIEVFFYEYKDRLIYDVEDYEKWNFGDVLIYPSNMSLRRYYWEILKFGIDDKKVYKLDRYSEIYKVPVR